MTAHAAHRGRPGLAAALGAAILFGLSTPLAKYFVGTIDPLMLAGLLYLGSGIGLSVWYALRRTHEARLRRSDLPWLAGAVLFGGILAPVLLLWGLASTEASTAALLLNLEGVLTALLAWLFFREHYGRRLTVGMGLIAAGGVLLVRSDELGLAASPGMLAIAGACLMWALDNNLTRRIAGADPVQITAIKGLIAGAVNLALAFAFVGQRPTASGAIGAMIVGLLGYGTSLVLFVYALRQLGAARTAAYFSTAPFLGAAFAVVWLNETTGLYFWGAAGLIATGVWLHLSEHHDHWHSHAGFAHDHVHGADAHHGHAHDFPWDGVQPHSHPHSHEPLTHSHPHAPDLHHRHRH